MFSLKLRWENFMAKLNSDAIDDLGKVLEPIAGYCDEQRKLIDKQEEFTKTIRCSTIWTAIATVIMAVATIGIMVLAYLQLIHYH